MGNAAEYAEIVRRLGQGQLRPILDRQLKPGTRVVSHDFDIPGWVPDKVESVKGDFVHDHKVLLFEIR